MFIVGGALVIKGGELVVGACLRLPAHTRMPAAARGDLAMLAAAAPALVVSLAACLRGDPALALGNVVGVAIANAALVVGLLCVRRPAEVDARDFRVPAWAMLSAGVLLACLTWRLELGRAEGVLLLVWGGVFLVVDDVRRQRLRASSKVASDGSGPAMSLRRTLVLFAVGAVLLVPGAALLCKSAVGLAQDVLGVPQMVVGLTLVALASSLPALLAATSAARTGLSTPTLGDLAGANTITILLVAGAAATITPLPLTARAQLYAFPAMLILFGVLLVLARPGRRLGRGEGWALVGLYAVYLIGLALIRE